MRPTRYRGLFLILILAVFVSGGLPASAQPVCRPCVAGIVLDGPWVRNDELRGLIEEEVLDLLGDDFQLSFPAATRQIGDWSLGGARQAVDALLADPDVDIVLTLGPVASAYVSRRASLPKPVVAAFVVEPEVQGVPLVVSDAEERVSGVPNLSYVTFSSDLEQSVRRLREITPFRRLTFLMSASLAEAVPELEENLLSSARPLDIDPHIVRVGSSLEQAIEGIPADTDAVYVFPLIQLPDGELQELIVALRDRRLPAFSFWGRSEVELRLLASIFADEAFDRLGRRIALNLQRILLGEDAGTLPVDFERRVRLSLNVETARAIGVYPSWSV